MSCATKTGHFNLLPTVGDERGETQKSTAVNLRRRSSAGLRVLVADDYAPLAFRPGAQGDSRGLFIQVVILVVLGALQRELESQAILCHLIDPNFGGNLYRSRISSARFACLGCSIRLT